MSAASEQQPPSPSPHTPQPPAKAAKAKKPAEAGAVGTQKKPSHRQALGAKDAEIAGLRKELLQMREEARHNAERAFLFKNKLDSLELRIQKFPVLRIRPLVPPVPAEVATASSCANSSPDFGEEDCVDWRGVALWLNELMRGIQVILSVTQLGEPEDHVQG